ncbi:MAG: hypothetical protein AB7E80_09180 [Hyphomicrobiaceae bacterium]
MNLSTPQNINPAQWHQAMGVARQSCARVFRDGGTPVDALDAFGLSGKQQSRDADWDCAVEAIAQMLCRQPALRAA